MKTTYIIICLVISLSVKAQFNAGIKVGVSIPDLKGNNEASKGYTSRMGVYAGLLGSIKLSHLFYLQPEINFSPQGGRRNGLQPVPSDAINGTALPPGTTLYARYNNETILNYLEIPILGKIIFGNKYKYYACFGPHIAFLLEAKTKTSGNSQLYLDKNGTIPLTENGNSLPPFSFNSSTNIKESIRKINAGIQGGVGIAHPLGSGSIFIDGRVIVGLTNVQAHPETDGKNQTGSVAVAAGYMINIK